MRPAPPIAVAARTTPDERLGFAAGLTMASLHLQAEAEDAQRHGALRVAEMLMGIAADLQAQANQVRGIEAVQP